MAKYEGKHIKSFDGTKIYYEVGPGGKDNCIVLLHGLGGDLSAWDKEKDYFQNEGVSTISIDLRGHGYSDRSDKEDFYKFTSFAKDVLEVMHEERFHNYSLVGHCFECIFIPDA